ncbi:MAG: M20 family metallo-hydrolase [Candidatus Glassbacteria bacterium]
MDSELLEKVIGKTASYRDEMISIQKKLTSMVALAPESGGVGEAEKASFLKQYLESMNGVKVEEIRAKDSRVPCGYRPNLIARLEGEKKDRAVWVMSHTDVVPAGESGLWKGDPFEAWEEDDLLYGRGVEDNQQGMVSSLFALKALVDLGVKPPYDVGLVLVADEEVGSKYGIDYLLERHPDLFREEDLIIIPDAGNEDGTMIEVAEKSIVWLKFKTKGMQCHASTPQKGVNAFKAASHLVVKLSSLYDVYNARNEIFNPPISTFEPTKKEANVPNVNTCPGEDVFYLDSRILPEYDIDEVRHKISKLAHEVEEEFGVTIQIEPVQLEVATEPTPDEAPVVKALQCAIKELRGREAKPMGIGGGTVASFFRRRGFKAAVWSTMEESAHQPNEYCKISNMIEDSKVFAHVFLQGY